jgi:hypothetical protein
MEDRNYWWFLFLFLYSLFNCSPQLEKGVDGLFDSFARLDTLISSVGQTAAKIGDHLQVICSSVSIPLYLLCIFADCEIVINYLGPFLFPFVCISFILTSTLVYQSAESQRETASQTIDLIKVTHLF